MNAIAAPGRFPITDPELPMPGAQRPAARHLYRDRPVTSAKSWLEVSESGPSLAPRTARQAAGAV